MTMPDNEQTDFAALAQRAQQMRREVADAQDELMAIQATGHGGGGLVTATVSGEGRLLELRIDPSVIDPADPQTLADLVIAAVDGANQAVAEQRAARVTAITDGLRGLLAGVRRDPADPGIVPLFANRPPVPAPPSGTVHPFDRPK
jgi:DNA-binding YbaB/EbfC family protein